MALALCVNQNQTTHDKHGQVLDCALCTCPCLLVDELLVLRWPGYLLHPAGEDQRGGAGDGGDPGLLLRLPPGHRQLAGQGRGPG